MAKFTKIETKRKSAYVAEQIVEAIRRGDYRKDGKLPPERDIAKQMEVSRASVREALSALQITGLLVSKAGNGTYVQRTSASREEEDLVLTLLEESPIEALEARRVLEDSIVRLAAVRSTPQNLREVESALERMRRAAQAKNYEAYAQSNQDFHEAIAQATGNVFIVKALLPLLEVMKRQLARVLREKKYLADSSFFKQSFKLHEQIFLALRARDAEAASAAMSRHFRVIEDSLEDSLSLKEPSPSREVVPPQKKSKNNAAQL